MSRLSDILGVNAGVICDCKNMTFRVGIRVEGLENHIRCLECVQCGHEMAVPFQTNVGRVALQDAEQ